MTLFDDAHMLVCFFVCKRRGKKTQYLPLVLGVPLDSEQETSLVIGIPPLNLDDERKK